MFKLDKMMPVMTRCSSSRWFLLLKERKLSKPAVYEKVKLTNNPPALAAFSESFTWMGEFHSDTRDTFTLDLLAGVFGIILLKQSASSWLHQLHQVYKAQTKKPGRGKCFVTGSTPADFCY